jgi:hypothetical protein
MEEGFQSDFKFIAGVIKATDELRMKRMIFRLSRGRAIATYFNYPYQNVNEVKAAVRILLIEGSKENIYNLFPKRS